MRAILLGGLLVLLAAGAAGAQPIGYIDGGYWGNGQYNVSGWACDPHSIRALSNSGTMTYPDNGIRGYIDAAPWDGNQVVVSGWACAAGVAQSVWVHIYVGGPAGSGSWFSAGVANLGNEPAVLQACGVGWGAYRYAIAVPFGAAEMMQLGAQKLYVHGISPIGGSNRLLGNSGVFGLPGSRASVSGGCGYVPAVWNAPYGSAV